MPPQVNLTHAAMLVQIFSDEKSIFESLKKTGHIPKTATKSEIEYVKERLRFAKKWVQEFADEQYAQTETVSQDDDLDWLTAATPPATAEPSSGSAAGEPVRHERLRRPVRWQSIRPRVPIL